MKRLVSILMFTLVCLTAKAQTNTPVTSLIFTSCSSASITITNVVDITNNVTIYDVIRFASNTVSIVAAFPLKVMSNVQNEYISAMASNQNCVVFDIQTSVTNSP